MEAINHLWVDRRRRRVVISTKKGLGQRQPMRVHGGKRGERTKKIWIDHLSTYTIHCPPRAYLHPYTPFEQPCVLFGVSSHENCRSRGSEWSGIQPQDPNKTWGYRADTMIHGDEQTHHTSFQTQEVMDMDRTITSGDGSPPRGPPVIALNSKSQNRLLLLLTPSTLHLFRREPLSGIHKLFQFSIIETFIHKGN